jgi:hypothetical protein
MHAARNSSESKILISQILFSRFSLIFRDIAPARCAPEAPIAQREA